MILFLLVFSLFAFTQSAVLPVDSSSVNVKQSGQEYAYSIQENHGFAIEPLPHHQIPVLKIAPESNIIKHEHLPIKEQEIKPLKPQVKSQQFLAVLPAYTYLPAHQYAIPYPYGVNYPYNLIATF